MFVIVAVVVVGVVVVGVVVRMFVVVDDERYSRHMLLLGILIVVWQQYRILWHSRLLRSNASIFRIRQYILRSF